MNKVIFRLKRLEAIRSRKRFALYPNNDDCFIQALGLNPSDYAVDSNSFDFLKALEDTALSDWEDEYDIL